jgi:hypothetical protein
VLRGAASTVREPRRSAGVPPNRAAGPRGAGLQLELGEDQRSSPAPCESFYVAVGGSQRERNGNPMNTFGFYPRPIDYWMLITDWRNGSIAIMLAIGSSATRSGPHHQFHHRQRLCFPPMRALRSPKARLKKAPPDKRGAPALFRKRALRDPPRRRPALRKAAAAERADRTLLQAPRACFGGAFSFATSDPRRNL